MNEIQNFFETALREWPTHFSVTALPSLAPGVISPGTIYNALSAKVGPPCKKVGGRNVLERDSFLHWLQNRPKMPRRDQAA